MKKLDSLLKKAAFFEKLANYGDRKSFLKALAQYSAAPPLTSDPSHPAFSDPSHPELDPVANLPSSNKPAVQSAPFNPEVKKIQERLNQIALKQLPAVRLNLKEDGKFGPETRKAVDWFKKTFNLSPSMSDKDVFAKINDEFLFKWMHEQPQKDVVP
jgi:hypothetical protein